MAVPRRVQFPVFAIGANGKGGRMSEVKSLYEVGKVAVMDPLNQQHFSW
jgi:hypothetical protein